MHCGSAKVKVGALVDEPQKALSRGAGETRDKAKKIGRPC
jgi:hypothetical protein